MACDGKIILSEKYQYLYFFSRAMRPIQPKSIGENTGKTVNFCSTATDNTYSLELDHIFVGA